MANYTIVVEDGSMATFEAFCANRGQSVQDYIQSTINGHVQTALAYAAQRDEVAKAAKLAQAETWEPTMTKYEKLEKADKDAVDAILAKVAVVAEEPIEP